MSGAEGGERVRDAAPSSAESVLVTHADTPLGRRVVQRLFRDESILWILAVGTGAPPSSFDPLIERARGRLLYRRVDLRDYRSAADLFGSRDFLEARVDTIIHIPAHTEDSAPDRGPLIPPLLGALLGAVRPPPPGFGAEARVVLRQAVEDPNVRQLISLGSAYVYRLTPGNANRLTEDSELDLDPRAPGPVRAWVENDLALQTDVPSGRLCVTLLRLPTVVTSGGELLLNPLLEAGPQVRPLGYDPLCPLVSDHDAVQAILLALRTRRAGIFNIAGCESVPLSTLLHWSGRSSVPLPESLLRLLGAAQGAAEARRRPGLEGPPLRYGFSLDTERARRDLGFVPNYRIVPALEPGDGAQIQAASSV